METNFLCKKNFETFFELPTSFGTNGTINLKYLNTNGSLDPNIEEITSAKVKASSNYNLEPEKVRECIIPYDVNHRPIILFIKISSSEFIYHFETFGSQLYTELEQLLSDADGGIKRTETKVKILRQSCQTLTV